MLRHFITIFIRSFKRYKAASFINLFGLAVGLSSALLIFLWVNDELNKDQFNEKDSDRHVQVLVNTPITTGINTSESTPGPLTLALSNEMPEVEYAVPIIAPRSFYHGILSEGNRSIRAKPQFVGDGYFDVFRCDFLAGSKEGALAERGQVVISDKMAMSLFQSVDQAVGQTVVFKNTYFDGSYIVTGVFNSRSNASSEFDVLFSYDRFLEGRPNMRKWNNGGIQAHLVLKEGVDIDQFNAKIKDYLTTKIENSRQTLYAQPFADKYLYGAYENGVAVEGRMVYVRLFTIIALFILAIACVNYMNLSTARASRRVKEIGVKKAVGAVRGSLVVQHFAESVFMTLLSFILAVGITLLLLPQFNEITGKQLTFDLATNVIIPVIVITLLTGLISGIYPALYLSGFKPILALKGKFQKGSVALWVRKGLVIFQFTISVILIFSVFVIYKQIEMVQTINLGYSKDHVISFPKDGKLEDDHEAFLLELKALSGVANASYLWGNFPGQIAYGDGFQWLDMDKEDLNMRFYSMSGGYDLIELLDIEMKEGHSFSRERPTDKQGVIINETAAKVMNYETDPIGQKFYDGVLRDVVGVVKDFHFLPLQEEIQPLFFVLGESGQHFLVKIQAGTERETIDKIQDLHDQLNPGYPFEYSFIDEDYQALYASEERIAVLSKYFAVIAIAISCLGLLALTAFSTEGRFKEIAVRKVLGASSFGVMQLMSREFIILVLISIVIALPIGYYLMEDWLNGFAYHITLGAMYFVAAGGFMLFVAWVTIMTQVFRSTKVNMSESLRSE
ncbi:MAG: ABC transporter permease [Roseivirga sp.]